MRQRIGGGAPHTRGAYFKGTKVYNPGRAREMRDGGYVVPKNNMTRNQLSHDSVMAILQPGEIVIPKRYYQRSTRKWINLAQRVSNDLRAGGFMLPGL